MSAIYNIYKHEVEDDTIDYIDSGWYDLDDIAKQRRDWGVFRDRRTDLYGPLLKNED